MATITGTINENGAAVGAGWKLIYGSAGDGIKTTNGSGQFTWADVAGAVKTGGSGTLIVAGGSHTFEV